MRHRLRALAFACSVTLIATGASMSIAAPSGAQEVTATDCGSTTYRWLFWPQGHDDLTSVPHPATDIPHLDLYSGKGKKFLDSQNVGYADGTSATTNDTCAPVELPGGGSASLKGTSQTKQLVCTFPSTPVFVAVPESTVDSPSLSALLDGALVVNAQLGDPGVGSFLDYNAKFCKLKKPPK